jgi:hypothetical protein
MGRSVPLVLESLTHLALRAGTRVVEGADPWASVTVACWGLGEVDELRMGKRDGRRDGRVGVGGSGPFDRGNDGRILILGLGDKTVS